jgi:hypothetical protein
MTALGAAKVKEITRAQSQERVADQINSTERFAQQRWRPGKSNRQERTWRRAANELVYRDGAPETAGCCIAAAKRAILPQRPT